MRTGFFFLLAVVLATSCTINRNVMFKTDHDYVFDTPPDSTQLSQYRISPNDIVSVRLFSNGGAKLLDITAGTQESSRFANFPNTSFLVELNGDVNLPVIGRVNLVGLTVKESADVIQERYEQYYQDPFVVVQVTNNRVVIFPGTGSQAAVITLDNNNTTLVEALALAGGLADRADARKIKLIRYIEGRREIYSMDLSTIEGLKYASMVVQANDVIYVEPVPEVAREVLDDVSPYVTLVSGLALIYAIVSGAF